MLDVSNCSLLENKIYLEDMKKKNMKDNIYRLNGLMLQFGIFELITWPFVIALTFRAFSIFIQFFSSRYLKWQSCVLLYHFVMYGYETEPKFLFDTG